jgi:hypothetical protein
MGTAVTTAPSAKELEQLRYEHELRQRSIARTYQARADAVFAEWGERAKPRVDGEDPEDYRRNQCVRIKKLLPYSDDKPAPDLPSFRELRSLKLWGLDRNGFEAVEPMIYRAAAVAYARDDTVPAGEMREVTKVDPVTGAKEIRFYGRRSFIADLGRPGRRAVIRTPDTHPGWFPKEVPSVWLSRRPDVVFVADGSRRF